MKWPRYSFAFFPILTGSRVGTNASSSAPAGSRSSGSSSSLVAIGGCCCSYSEHELCSYMHTSIEVWTPDNSSWSQLSTSLPEPTAQMAGAHWRGGLVLFGGRSQRTGKATTNISYFSLLHGASWAGLHKMRLPTPQSFGSLGRGVPTTDPDSILFFGVHNDAIANSASPESYVVDLRRQTVRRGPNCPWALSFATVLLLPSGNALFAGGLRVNYLDKARREGTLTNALQSASTNITFLALNVSW